MKNIITKFIALAILMSGIISMNTHAQTLIAGENAEETRRLHILELPDKALLQIMAFSENPHVRGVCQKFRRLIERCAQHQPFVFQLAENVYGLTSVHTFPYAFLAPHILRLIASCQHAMFEHESAKTGADLPAMQELTPLSNWPGLAERVADRFHWPLETTETLNYFLCICAATQTGENESDFDIGIDDVLERQYSNFSYLETTQEMLSSYAGATLDEQYQCIEMLLAQSDEELASESKDGSQLPESLAQAEQEAMEETDIGEKILNQGCPQRNLLMTARIVQTQNRLPDQKILVIAGIDHWLGKDGILNLYRHLTGRQPLLLQAKGTFAEDEYLTALPSLDVDALGVLKEKIAVVPPIERKK